MKELRAILLEEADIEDKVNLNSDNCISADIVVFRGQIIKNRHGDIDTSNVEFSGGAPLHGAASAGTKGYASCNQGERE